MILTTTNSIEGFKIIEYKGIVTGVSTKMKKGSFTFSMTKYVDSLESFIEEAKEKAFQDLRANAVKQKANAVVGIKVDIEPLASMSMFLVSITGTAVKVA